MIYAAPEKIRKHATTIESEVYSLVVCVFTFLTGKSPFWRRDENKSDLDEAVKIVHYPGLDSDLMKKRGWEDEEIEGLNDIFNKSFDVDPEKRFRTATELAEALERMLMD